MKRAFFALLIGLSVPGLVAVANSAPGDKQQGDKKAEKASDNHDPENITAISQYMENVAKGAEQFKKGDHTAAVDLFKKAVPLAPKNPLAHLLLGEAYLAKNNLSEAEAAFLAAREAATASDAKGLLFRSHVLFAVADVYERQKKWTEAKTAWQAYLEQASRLGPDSGAHPASGVARKAAVDKVLEREKLYAAVRERIAAEKDGGAKAGAAPAKK
jgi:thioredoxin-like negative regulator of GroEL